jgi:hypothetical protein
VLLYRLLIEIVRQNEGAGTFEDNDLLLHKDPAHTERRNLLRNVVICWNAYGNSHVSPNVGKKTSNIINFGIQFPLKQHPTICERKDSAYMIALSERPSDVSLFHEMLHWYHALRDIARHDEEKDSFAGTAALTDSKLGKYYWGTDQSASWKISAIPWVSKIKVPREEEMLVVNCEEIRTILGSCRDVPGYLEGDDLSENLYRLSRGGYLRFGHTLIRFYEDKDVIEKAIEVCKKSASSYSIDKSLPQEPQLFPIRNLSTKERPMLPYGSSFNESGIGSCEIFTYGVGSIRGGQG